MVLQVVGDDLLMSNPKRIERAILESACNSLLLKVSTGLLDETKVLLFSDNDVKLAELKFFFLYFLCYVNATTNYQHDLKLEK